MRRRVPRSSRAQLSGDGPGHESSLDPTTSTESGAEPDPYPGQKFVAGVENDSTTYLRYQGMGVWPSDSQLISLGQSICTSIEDAGAAATVTTLDGSPNFSDLGVSAQQMMDLAQVNLCPQTMTGG